jgi:AraC family transcriptional regulator, transcriptional activator FtrA
MHRVVALCFDGLVAFDLTAPAQAFASAYRTLAPAEGGGGRIGAEGGSALYEFSSCSVNGGEVRTTTGFAVRPQSDLSALETADTVVVPAYFDVFSPPPEAVLAALRRAADRGARVLSVCTGAFALAHAGLLDGRRATTHWAFAAELAKRFPAVEVDASVLYVDEGAVMTSAGLSAGIDLCLHAIRKDFGAVVGERVARHMVAAPHRDGGQAQFIERPGPAEARTTSSLAETRRWAADRLDRPLDVATMAGHAGVSPRTFARRFREETGATPLQWLLSQRVHEARRLLEETDLPIETVAWRSGFGTAASLRDHFRRATATTPTAYRRSFRPVAA